MVRAAAFSLLSVGAADDCVDYMNQYRSSLGLYALGGGYGSCEPGVAEYDCVNGAHSEAYKCGNAAQCEAGCSTCQQAIDLFWQEGPGGGHYDIMTSDSYSDVWWGEAENCAGGYPNWFTFNFFTSGNVTNTSEVIDTSAKAATITKQVEIDDCVDYMNQYRASLGLYALGGGYGSCEPGVAEYDCVNGAHSEAYKCGNAAQCEAGCSTCQQAIDLFWQEGPGGGHYDIMTSDSYSDVWWGEAENCAGGYPNWFTFNFFTSGNQTSSIQV